MVDDNNQHSSWQRKELVRPDLQRISDVEWEISPSFKRGMNVPARLFATEALLKEMDLTVFDQLTNVASLPGIVKAAYCMPDAHSGYGFPIGGVAAFDPEIGVISPGGIGFDINCGMRLVTTNLSLKEVQPKIRELVDMLFKRVPSGVGGSGFLKLNNSQFDEVMQTGAKWCVEQGYGWKSDLDAIEENGCIKGADPSAVSDRARSRGINQVGTLGSGNHYLEVQTPSQIQEPELAKQWGIQPDGIVVMVHCGSRGFGHQVGTDYLLSFDKVMREQGIKVLDRELSCAPFSCPEGQRYFKAMACAANMAFANRQVILHRIRECFEAIFKRSAEDLGMRLVYDVCHNIAKLEDHEVDGKKRELLVHRKGATRCFGPTRMGSLFPMGQPVIIGGSMETGSYVLVGNDASAATFASTAHGSGRTMSRTKAKGMIRGDALQKDMEQRGIYVRTASYAGLAEEAGFAYKDISEVVKTMTQAGVSRPVVALRPIGNVKG